MTNAAHICSHYITDRNLPRSIDIMPRLRCNWEEYVKIEYAVMWSHQIRNDVPYRRQNTTWERMLKEILIIKLYRHIPRDVRRPETIIKTTNVEGRKGSRTTMNSVQ
jgi:hypothetical protein